MHFTVQRGFPLSFSPSHSFSFPFALLPYPLYIHRNRNHHRPKYIKNSSISYVYKQYIHSREKISLDCWEFFLYVVYWFICLFFFSAIFFPEKYTSTITYDNSCINLSKIECIFSSQKGILL